MGRLLLFLLALSSAFGISREEIVYRSTPQGPLKMTIFYPDQWKPSDSRPATVFFFGGGFTQFFSKAGYLASRGMVAISAEYRLNIGREEPLLDCQAAYQFLHGHTREHGIDAARLSAGGGSSGGRCALSIVESGQKPATLVLFNPGGLDQKEPSNALPPTILFFGSADPRYPAARAYWRKAQSRKLPVQLYVAQGQAARLLQRYRRRRLARLHHLSG